MLTHSLSTLSSGLTLITVPMPAVESVTVMLLAKTGSRYEKADAWGVAHFLEHMVFKGTKKYPSPHDVASKIDGIGADFNAFTSKEYTGYYIQADAKHISLTLDMLSEMLLKPLLKTEDIEREKGVIVEELNMYVDTPQRFIANEFENMLYQPTGLGHNVIGTKESILGMKWDHFQDFLRTFYGLGNLVLVIAGKADLLQSNKREELVQEIETVFHPDAITDRDADAPDLSQWYSQNALSAQRLKVIHKETEQAHFVLGWPAFKRQDPRRYALTIMSAILGGNMSSRLFTEVREKRGLCYYVYSDIDQYQDVGMFGAAAGVDVKRLDEAIEVTVEQFTALAGSQPIAAAELQKAKDYLSGKVVLNLEESQNVAQWFGMKQILLSEIETPAQVLEKISGVTLEEVRELAKQLIVSGELRLAVIGPVGENQDRFQKFL